MSLREMLVTPDRKKERHFPGCKVEKTGGCEHNGRKGHAKVVSNQNAEHSRPPNLGHRERAKKKSIVARWIPL